jgi:hypothetical protein
MRPDCGPALHDHGKGTLVVAHVPDPRASELRAAEKARISAERKANRTQKSGYAPKVSKGHKKGNTTPKSSGNPGK